jgi:hypothetical protein
MMTTAKTAEQLATIPSKMLVLTLRPRPSDIAKTARYGIAAIMDTAKAHASERHAAPKNFVNILTSQAVPRLEVKFSSFQ